MIPIVTIGYHKYAFKTAKVASEVVAAIAAAQQVEETYTYKHGQVFFPADEAKRSRSDLRMEMARPEQILTRKPTEDDPEPEPLLASTKRLPARSQPRQITNGGAA